MNPNTERERPLRVIVVGAGAVGGYVGAALSLSGHDVTLVARGEHGRQMAEGGVVVETSAGELSARPRVVHRLEEAAEASADVVMVAVKAGDLAGVASGILPTLAADGVVIPLLNGLDSEAELAREVGANHVVGAITQLSARVVAPGRVRVDGPSRITLAPLAPPELPKVEHLARVLSSERLLCEARPDLSRLLWNKLLWNAPFNAVCALTRRTAGEALEVPELEALLRAAMREVVLVARAEGVEIRDSAIDRNIEVTRTGHRATVPSMLQDVLRGRPTEARALQGAVIDRARRHAIATPVLGMLFALLLGLERP